MVGVTKYIYGYQFRRPFCTEISQIYAIAFGFQLNGERKAWFSLFLRPIPLAWCMEHVWTTPKFNSLFGSNLSPLITERNKMALDK